MRLADSAKTAAAAGTTAEAAVAAVATDVVPVARRHAAEDVALACQRRLKDAASSDVASVIDSLLKSCRDQRHAVVFGVVVVVQAVLVVAGHEASGKAALVPTAGSAITLRTAAARVRSIPCSRPTAARYLSKASVPMACLRSESMNSGRVERCFFTSLRLTRDLSSSRRRRCSISAYLAGETNWTRRSLVT